MNLAERAALAFGWLYLVAELVIIVKWGRA